MLAPAPQLESLFISTESVAGASLSTRIVTGRREILARMELLVEMSLRYDQQGAMDHLEYFLTAEDSLKKTPHLVVVGARVELDGVLSEEPIGALLIYEYRVFGCGSGIFCTDDTTGRRTLIAPADHRLLVAKLAGEALLQSGALVVFQSFMEIASEAEEQRPAPILSQSLISSPSRSVRQTRRRAEFATVVREIPSYLPLESTMNATLAKIGQRTRSNLRYYRRRAESQLGCTFVEDVRISRFEFKRFNRQCTYAVKDEMAGWRYDSIGTVPGMFLCGIKDRNGHWLSMVGARRYYDMVEIDWQMNRDDLPAYSLSTVMRACFIEQEICHGTRRMYIKGGTPHAMRFSFATDRVRDLIVLKRSLLVSLLRRIALRFLPKTNSLMLMLTQPDLEWQPWS